MTFQKQLQTLQSKVRFMFSARDKYIKSRDPKDLKLLKAAEADVRKLVFPPKTQNQSLFEWLAQ